MPWQWTLVLGAILAPWVLMGKMLKIGFEERGLSGGLGAWLGVAILTTPLMFLLSWVFGFFFHR